MRKQVPPTMPASPPTAADLLLRNGRVITVDHGFAVTEAVAIHGPRITATGDSATLSPLIGPQTRIIDLDGATVLPGINDSHLHLALYAQSRPPFAFPLSGLRTIRAIRAALAAQAQQRAAGEWIRGDGFERRHLGRAPNRADLDPVSPAHPVVLEDATHHLVSANSLALARAGVTRDTADPPGGRIVRDDAGEPTGELLEAAQQIVLGAVPPVSARLRRAAIERAGGELLAAGVTSVTDPAVWPDLLDDYTLLHEGGWAGPRLNVLLNWDWPSVSASLPRLQAAVPGCGLTPGLGNGQPRIRGVKLFADGVPSLGTAWMSEPDAYGGTGSLVCAGDDDAARQAQLHAMIAFLHSRRLHVQVHATGDRACTALVDAYVDALEADPWPHARHVVIHGNFLSDSSAARMARHGLVANVNSLIQHQLSPALAQRLGPARAVRNMPWGSLVRAGVHVADSSDAPVVEPDWRRALQCLVTRDDGQALSRSDAIRAWTIEPAYQDGLDQEKGSIEPGKLADLVVVAEDVLSIPDDRLHLLTPVMTILGGMIVHGE